MGWGIQTTIIRAHPAPLLDIWWDIEIALPNAWYDMEWRKYTYCQQPSCVGGKYGLPLSGTDARKHQSVMTPINGRDTSLTKHMHKIGKMPTRMVPLNSITLI